MCSALTLHEGPWEKCSCSERVLNSWSCTGWYLVLFSPSASYSCPTGFRILGEGLVRLATSLCHLCCPILGLLVGVSEDVSLRAGREGQK